MAWRGVGLGFASAIAHDPCACHTAQAPADMRHCRAQVGSEVARRGIGLGFAAVIAYDPYASDVKAAALGVKLVPWEEALARGDFFSLHMPMTATTKVLGPAVGCCCCGAALLAWTHL